MLKIQGWVGWQEIEWEGRRKKLTLEHFDMSEAKPISILGFQDSLISLERFVLCDTSGIKPGNICLIFSKSCIFDCS